MTGELTPETNVVAQGIAGQITRGIGKCIGSFFVDEQFCDLKDMCLSCNHRLKEFLQCEEFPETRSMIITHDYVNADIIKLVLDKNKIL